MSLQSEYGGGSPWDLGDLLEVEVMVWHVEASPDGRFGGIEGE